MQIEQVILNLLRNAIDAMDDDTREQSWLLVCTRRGEDGFVEVSVSDRGSGITIADEARLFEPFFTTKESGMGMGLSISRSIIDAHGGRFWFTRNSDHGVTFHFTLPIAGSELS